MKKDIVFILLVIIAGIAGIVYTKTNQNDILTEIQKERIRDSKGQLQDNNGDGLHIDYRSSARGDYSSDLNNSTTGALGIDSSEVDESTLRSLNDLEQTEESLLDELKGDNSEQVKKVELENSQKANWSRLYNAWYLVYVDSSSPDVNVEDLSSRRDCELIIELKDDTLTVLKFTTDTKLEIFDQTLTMVSSKRSVSIAPLVNVDALFKATKVLKRFCESN